MRYLIRSYRNSLGSASQLRPFSKKFRIRIESFSIISNRKLDKISRENMVFFNGWVNFYTRFDRYKLLMAEPMLREYRPTIRWMAGRRSKMQRFFFYKYLEKRVFMEYFQFNFLWLEARKFISVVRAGFMINYIKFDKLNIAKFMAEKDSREKVLGRYELKERLGKPLRFLKFRLERDSTGIDDMRLYIKNFWLRYHHWRFGKRLIKTDFNKYLLKSKFYLSLLGTSNILNISSIYYFYQYYITRVFYLKLRKINTNMYLNKNKIIICISSFNLFIYSNIFAKYLGYFAGYLTGRFRNPLTKKLYNLEKKISLNVLRGLESHWVRLRRMAILRQLKVRRGRRRKIYLKKKSSFYNFLCRVEETLYKRRVFLLFKKDSKKILDEYKKGLTLINSSSLLGVYTGFSTMYHGRDLKWSGPKAPRIINEKEIHGLGIALSQVISPKFISNRFVEKFKSKYECVERFINTPQTVLVNYIPEFITKSLEKKFIIRYALWLGGGGFHDRCLVEIYKLYRVWIFFINYAVNFYVYFKLYYMFINHIFNFLYREFSKLAAILRLTHFEFCYDLVKWKDNTRYYLGIDPRIFVKTFNNRIKKGFRLTKIVKDLTKLLKKYYDNNEIKGYYIRIKGRYQRGRRKKIVVLRKGFIAFNSFHLQLDSAYGLLHTRFGIAGLKIIFAY